MLMDNLNRAHIPDNIIVLENCNLTNIIGHNQPERKDLFVLWEEWYSQVQVHCTTILAGKVIISSFFIFVIICYQCLDYHLGNRGVLAVLLQLLQSAQILNGINFHFFTFFYCVCLFSGLFPFRTKLINSTWDSHLLCTDTQPTQLCWKNCTKFVHFVLEMEPGLVWNHIPHWGRVYPSRQVGCCCQRSWPHSRWRFQG